MPFRRRLRVGGEVDEIDGINVGDEDDEDEGGPKACEVVLVSRICLLPDWKASIEE